MGKRNRPVSKLALFFSKLNAEAVKPDMDAIGTGKNNLRHAMGVTHLPECKPVMYFLFQNTDKGPEEGYCDNRQQYESLTDSLNRVSCCAAGDSDSCLPDELDEESFNQQHFMEVMRENTRPTMPANMAMAVSIENHRRFEQLALQAGRAFLADSGDAADLTLTVAYIPAHDPQAKWPTQPPYQLTFSPRLAPLLPLELPSEAARRAEPEMYDQRGAQAAQMMRKLLKPFGMK